MRRYAIILISLLLLAISACRKENPVPVAAQNANGVFITNEGDFNSGEGEVSFYNPAAETISNGLFYRANGYHLGDVAQSMYIKDSIGFIVVNNSAKVEVVKIPSLKHIITIAIPNSSPRYFLPINDSTAYVTDLYASEVHVINYLTGAIITNITGVAGWTERMVMVNGNVVVEERSLLSNPSTTGSVAVINPATNTFMQRYSFAGSNVDGIVSDNMGRVWFGMDADSAANIPAAIYCLNTDMSLNKRIVLGVSRMASNLKINSTGKEIYYFDNNGVNAVSINDTVPPAVPFSPVNGRNLYGLGVDPRNGDVYVSDALDYVQNSKVYRYDKNGNLVNSFTAGVISGDFAFYYH